MNDYDSRGEEDGAVYYGPLTVEEQKEVDFWEGQERAMFGSEQEYQAYLAAMEQAYEEHVAIEEGRAIALIHCYLCEPDVNKRLGKDAGPLRGIKREFTVEAHRDPTAAYELIPCGHTII